MRLEIVDTPPKDQVNHYRSVRRRLMRSDAGRRMVPLHPNIPLTPISWTFGNITATGNVIAFDFSPITIHQIIDAVCEFYNVSCTDVVSDRRHAKLVYPRHVAMYLARELTPKSYPLIGQLFGNRDHTTAMYGWRKIKALLDTDERMADEIAVLMRKIRS